LATYPVAVARSAVVVVVPAADAVVEAHRLQHDPLAVRGVPAHVTILYPFRSDVDGATVGLVGEICRSFRPFETTFATVGRFPEGVVWLRPDPGEDFVALTAAFAAAFPDCPPYGGEFAEVIPHLTVGSGLDAAEADALEQVLAPRLPLTTRVDQLTLLVEQADGTWRVNGSWPLGADGVVQHRVG
jgi:2'-5' RNA ligase superfamily